jgi:hypothetical protein
MLGVIEEENGKLRVFKSAINLFNFINFLNNEYCLL